MVDATQERLDAGTRATALSQARRFAWLAIVVVDVRFLAWGTMAALALAATTVRRHDLVAALALTAPFFATRRPRPSTG